MVTQNPEGRPVLRLAEFIRPSLSWKWDVAGNRAVVGGQQSCKAGSDQTMELEV